jgi:hypothetical protein
MATVPKRGLNQDVCEKMVANFVKDLFDLKTDIQLRFKNCDAHIYSTIIKYI